MKRYAKELGLMALDGQYMTDRSDIDVITFSAASLTNPYIVPDDVETSKVRENSTEYDFFE